MKNFLMCFGGIVTILGIALMVATANNYDRTLAGITLVMMLGGVAVMVVTEVTARLAARMRKALTAAAAVLRNVKLAYEASVSIHNPARRRNKICYGITLLWIATWVCCGFFVPQINGLGVGALFWGSVSVGILMFDWSGKSRPETT